MSGRTARPASVMRPVFSILRQRSLFNSAHNEFFARRKPLDGNAVVKPLNRAVYPPEAHNYNVKRKVFKNKTRFGAAGKRK